MQLLFDCSEIQVFDSHLYALWHRLDVQQNENYSNILYKKVLWDFKRFKNKEKLKFCISLIEFMVRLNTILGL